MKTEKLQLQPYDNIDSILDKMNQIYQITRGLTQLQVFWPKRGRVLGEALDFGRIAGWAQRSGLQLVFVCDDPLVRKRAQEHDIRVVSRSEDIPRNAQYRSTRFQLKRSDSQRMIKLARLRGDAEKTRPKKASSKWGLPLFLAALTAFFAGLYVLLPHASVTLRAVPVSRTLDFPLWTDDQLSALTMNGGVPSDWVRFSVERSATVASSGTIQATGRLATGTLQLENHCEKEQQISAGVHFSERADRPWLFHSLEAVRIPAGATIEIAIEADSPGAQANLAPDSVQAVQVPYDQCLTIHQPAATAGGDDGVFVAPTAADYQAAAGLIEEQILADSATLMQEKSGNLYYPLKQSFKIEKVLSEKLEPALGYAGDTLKLEQKVELSMRMVARQDVYRQVQLLFSSNPVVGFQSQNSTYTYTIQDGAQPFENGQYILNIHAEQTGLALIQTDELRALISGKSKAEAAEIIRQRFSAASDPVIHIWPNWMDRLPLSAANIWIQAE